MRFPPTHLKLLEKRTTVHLVAFVEHNRIYEWEASDTNFFLGFYIKTKSSETQFYLCLVDESGQKQRKLYDAGDIIESAAILATAVFPISVLDVTPFQTVCQKTLFKGHQNNEMKGYKKQLSKVRKRLERIQRAFWNIQHENSR